MRKQPSDRRGRRSAAAGWLAAILALVSGCSPLHGPHGALSTAAPASETPPAALQPPGGQAATGAADDAPPAPLAVGEPRQDQIAGGQRHSYPLELEAGAYARVVLEQLGRSPVDLRLLVEPPDGGEPASSAGPAGARMDEQVSLVAPVSGRFEVVVEPVEPQAAGGVYRLELAEVRPGEPTDPVRVEVERLINDAQHLRALETEEADNRQRPELTRALELASGAGLRSLEGDALTLLGLLDLKASRNVDARERFEGALAAYQQVDDVLGQATALDNLGLATLGLATRGQSEFSVPIEYFHRAFSLWEELGDVGSQANNLHNLGAVLRASGDLDGALATLERALELQRSAGLAAGEAYTLVTLGHILRQRGDIDQAFDYANRALELSERVGRSSRPACLNLLALLQRVRGDFQGALTTLLEAQRLSREMGQPAAEAKVLDNLGIVYLDLGQTDLAVASFNRALATFRDLGDPEGQVDSLLALGSAAEQSDDDEGALATYRQALEIGAGLPKLRTRRAVLLQRIGSAQLGLGRLDEAVASLGQALELRLELHDRRGEAQTRLQLADALARTGDAGAAGGHFERVLEVSREIGFRLAESRAELGLGRLAWEADELTAARERIERALAIYEELRSGLIGEELRTAFFTGSREYYDAYVSVLVELARTTGDRRFVARAFEASERARARGLLELLAEARVEVRAGVDPELVARQRAVEERMSAAETDLATLQSAETADPDALGRVRDRLERLDQERLEVDLEIRRRSPRYAAVRYPEPLGEAATRALLTGEQALLEYQVGERTSHLFVVVRDGVEVLDLPGAAEIERLSLDFRRALTERGRRSLPIFERQAREAYRVLLEPAESALAGRRELLIAPDAALYYLPFETLLTAPSAAVGWEDLPYLIADRSVSYVPSASVLAELLEARTGRPPAEGGAEQFVAFADPAFGGPSSDPGAPPAEAVAAAGEQPLRGGTAGEWPELPATATEVEEIARRFGEGHALLFLGDRATEDNVKSSPALRSARWVHFATHGFLDEQRPERSGLVLAATGGSGEDGILRVDEIFNLELSADLAVLSACDTGLGKRLSGEGLVGLTRSFLYAGAAAVVVSLWQVEDRSTADLMVRLKENLDRGDDHAEALRRAKLGLISDGRFAEPRLWAPFILVGDRSASAAGSG